MADHITAYTRVCFLASAPHWSAAGVVCKPSRCECTPDPSCCQRWDPSQLWHQDHWRQFGNSTVTATLGMQDIDHLNKEAFVLINKGTRKMLACGSHGEPMGLVDYAPGCNCPAVHKLILMEPVSPFFFFCSPPCFLLMFLDPVLWDTLIIMFLQQLACCHAFTLL